MSKYRNSEENNISVFQWRNQDEEVKALITIIIILLLFLLLLLVSPPPPPHHYRHHHNHHHHHHHHHHHDQYHHRLYHRHVIDIFFTRMAHNWATKQEAGAETIARSRVYMYWQSPTTGSLDLHRFSVIYRKRNLHFHRVQCFKIGDTANPW